jgi:hypothetical protein
VRRRRRPRAGRELRAALDEALAAASAEIGGRLEWSEQERLILDRAAAAADRLEELGRVYAEKLAAGAEPGTLVKLSAELRACERAAVDLVGKIHVGVGAAKSERHVKAASSRWDRRNARRCRPPRRHPGGRRRPESRLRRQPVDPV